MPKNNAAKRESAAVALTVPATTTASATPAPTSTTPPATIPAPQSDGFNATDEAGGSGLIKGEKIKFSNAGEWLSGDTVIAADREFIVIKLLRATQKWRDGRPVETVIIADDAYFPDIKTLNAEVPLEEKHEAFGKMVGPFQNVILAYLICPASMQAFCWPTSTMGGFRAIQELKDATRAHAARRQSISARDARRQVHEHGLRRKAAAVLRHQGL
jgi:hypothetical protein